jgi:hypothetical protein
MAGGYGVRIEETVALQVESFRQALHFWNKFQDANRTPHLITSAKGP